jgi:2-phosphosulfolactate phosphatase
VSVYEQDGRDLRLEWGRDGVAALGPHCAVVVVVDVLVFTTTVDIALGRGGRVLPLPWRDERGVEAARAAGAVLTRGGLAGVEGRDGGMTTLRADGAAREWTLRPSSLVELPAGTFLAISSPNGATLCAAAAETGAAVLAGCLRNASAVARAAVEIAGGAPIGIVPAGERWRDTPDKRLRPGIEELLGAGAIADAILRLRAGRPDVTTDATRSGATGHASAATLGSTAENAGDASRRSTTEHAGGTSRGSTTEFAGGGAEGAAERGWHGASAEAELAALTYRAAGDRVPELVADSVSGRELIAAGVPEDVRLATQVDVSAVVPRLVDGALVSAESTSAR